MTNLIPPDDARPPAAALWEETTDRRLQRIRDGAEDPALIALYFQFGRYLLISSACGGDLPPNLQGIWARDITPPWNADFHININLQMNHWPAGPCNLIECQWPLMRWIETLADSGRRTAEVHYGCPPSTGWVAHHISDPWGFSVPGDHADAGLWPTGGAWLCLHLWEHYLFTGELDTLAHESFPIMLDACRFFLHYLVEHDGQTPLRPQRLARESLPPAQRRIRQTMYGADDGQPDPSRTLHRHA